MVCGLRAACVTALLVGLALCAVSARPGGRANTGRMGKPKPLVVYACNISTDEGQVLKQRECYNGAPCTLGPLFLEGKQNDTLTAFFCMVNPTLEDPLPGVLRASCLVETDDDVLHERECPMTSECDLGPVEYATQNGPAYAYFCSKPEVKPDHSKESSEEGDEDEEESIESSEEVDEQPEERRPRPAGVRERRQRRHAGGRGGRGGHGGRGSFFRRPRSMISYACNVADDEGETVRSSRCRGDAECSLGPLTLEGKDNATLTTYFCDVQATKERLLLGVVKVSCLVETDDEILHERECPLTSECDLGPLDLALTEGPAYAYFCTKPDVDGRRPRYPESSEHSSEEDNEDASSSEEEIVTEVPGSPDDEVPETPEIPQGGAPEELPEGWVIQGAE